jgi:hypothetical protein
MISLDDLAVKQLAQMRQPETFNQRHLQATNSASRERRQAVAVLQGRAAALTVDIAEGDDGALRVVDLNTLPVHAGGSAVAGALAAAETVKLC